MLPLLIVLLGLISHGSCQLRPGQKDPQRGTFLGHFETLDHDVGGAVWALDEEWLRVEGFTYDGRGPDAFFWVGTEGEQPSPKGFLVSFPSNGSGGRDMVLPAFHGSDVLFRLPDKLKVSDLRWISVWCRRFTVNFGSLLVPRNIELPMKRKISELSRLDHGVRSGNVTLLDAKTLYIPNLHYDGSAPDAFFWVGKGKPDRTGRKIPNEKQSTAVLGHYDGVDIELVLPDNLTLYDIDYLSIWCVSYRHNFGHVMIPHPSELYLPPALGQTQVKAGSELQPVGSDPRNQYDVVDQVPDTETTESATETIDRAIAETTDRATAKTTDRATAKTTDHATAEMTDRATAETTDRATAETTDRATAETTDRTTAKTTDHATAETTDRATAKTTDRTTAETTDRASTETDRATATAMPRHVTTNMDTTEPGTDTTEYSTVETTIFDKKEDAEAAKAETVTKVPETQTETTSSEAGTEISFTESVVKVTITETTKSASGSIGAEKVVEKNTTNSESFDVDATNVPTEPVPVTTLSPEEEESTEEYHKLVLTDVSMGNTTVDEMKITSIQKVIGIKMTGPSELSADRRYYSSLMFRKARSPEDNDELPTDPSLNYAAMDSNTTFASNYSEVSPEDLSSLANPNLTTNNYTFKFDNDSEIQPVDINHSSQITEVLIHNKKDEYTFAVGDDESVQAVVDSVNSGNDYDPRSLVKVDILKHSGAYFFGKPNGTGDEETTEVPTAPEGDHEESGAPPEAEEDLIQPYNHHPKDIYSVKVPVSPDVAGAEEETTDENNDDMADSNSTDKSLSRSSTERVSVPGGIYTALLAVIELSLLMWNI